MTRAIPFVIIAILLLTVSLLAAGGLGAQGSGGPSAQNASGSIRGLVDLQGSADNSGAVVEVAGQTATTNPAGEYVLPSVPAGFHTITVRAAGFLSASRDVEVRPEQTTHLPTVVLLFGDLDRNGVIDVFDLASVGRNLGGSTGWGFGEEFSDGVLPDPGPGPGPGAPAIPPEEVIKLNLLRELQSLKAILRNDNHLRLVDDLMIKVDAMLEIESVELATKGLAIREVEYLIKMMEEGPGPIDNGGTIETLSLDFRFPDPVWTTAPLEPGVRYRVLVDSTVAMSVARRYQ